MLHLKFVNAHFERKQWIQLGINAQIKRLGMKMVLFKSKPTRMMLDNATKPFMEIKINYTEEVDTTENDETTRR